MIVDYVAQVPYYLHNYYVPAISHPRISGNWIIGFTLVWFVIGYIACIKKLKYGYAILLRYLIVQALFYGMTFLSGAFIMQLRNHSDIIRVVLLVGYTSGLVAAYCAYQLIRFRIHMQIGSSKTI